MKTIYVDYNLIAIMGSRLRPNATRLEEHLLQLLAHDHRVVLSAWHMLELSRSRQRPHIDACIDLVERLGPLWASNPSYIKAEELKGFLAAASEEFSVECHTNPAFNTTESQMWSTYGEAYVGETFAHTVNAWVKNPTTRDPIDKAVCQTPKAILIGREAMRDGRTTKCQPIVDREYFKSLVGRAGPSAIEFLVDNIQYVLDDCPAVAIEDYLTKTRVVEKFTPKESDASDLQHAIVGVAYCDYFVSDDKMLIEHCRRSASHAGVPCKVERTLLDIDIN